MPLTPGKKPYALSSSSCTSFPLILKKSDHPLRIFIFVVVTQQPYLEKCSRFVTRTFSNRCQNSIPQSPLNMGADMSPKCHLSHEVAQDLSICASASEPPWPLRCCAVLLVDKFHCRQLLSEGSQFSSCSPSTTSHYHQASCSSHIP